MATENLINVSHPTAYSTLLPICPGHLIWNAVLKIGHLGEWTLK